MRGVLKSEAMCRTTGPHLAQQRRTGDLAMQSIPTLTAQDAETVANACLLEAQNLKVAICVVVVDAAGHLLRLVRMDGARGLTADLATRKARTASSLGVSTSVLEMLYKDRPLSSQDLIAAKGGLPMLHDGQCSGAVGISGALPDIDEQIADAGVRALG